MLIKVKKLIVKILNLEVMILLDYQNIKIFSKNAMFQNAMLLVIFKANKLLERFTKRNCKNKSKRV